MNRLRAPIVRYVRLLVRTFFRRVQVVGRGHVPATGGGIVVSWHPNGLVDPGLIVATSPRPIVFGARDGLFRWPGLGWMIRQMGTVPIHRAQDRPDQSPAERRAANARSLASLARAVADGGLTCVFPEGDSHDAPHPLVLRLGAARLYYLARQLSPAGAPPVIVPVGLHYDAKRRFRSNALVTWHPPLALPPELDVTPPEEEPEEVSRDREQRLTDRIDAALRDVVHPTESWKLHFLLHRASRLLRAERAHRAGVDLEEPHMLERQLGFARIWSAYGHELRRDPDAAQALMDRLAEYDRDLRALGIEDHELDRAPRPGRIVRAALLVAQVVGVYVVLPAPLVLGAVVNAVPLVTLKVISKVSARQDKDVATIMVLTGTLLFPLTWAIAAALGAWASVELHERYPVIPSTPGFAAVVVAGLGVVGGMAALRYVRLVRETARAMRVRLTRARQRMSLANLRVERSELADALLAWEVGFDLPGSVASDGTVLATEEVPVGGQP